MKQPAFLSLKPGAIILAKGRRCKVTHILDATQVLVTDLETQVATTMHVGDIAVDPGEETGAVDLQSLSDEDWAKAQQRFEAIRPLVENPYRTRADAEAAAEKAGVGTATIYAWLKVWEESKQLSALVPSRRGVEPGRKRVDTTTEAIIDGAIRNFYLTKQRRSAQSVVNEVEKQCKAAGIKPPHPNTVRNRIKALPAAMTLRRRGLRDKARDQYEPIRGAFPGADFPLAIVQIDHTQGDVVLVDNFQRLPLGRPWITVAIDVYSRMIVGIYISLERPSAAAAGICLSRAMLPKQGYLKSLDLEGEWLAYGRIAAVHADNAKEFRGTMLARACEEYGIDLQMRPVKRPHYGGHIERLMGTLAKELAQLPGATFSDPKKRKGYDSEKEAALTLEEFEAQLVDFVVNIYHNSFHTGLNDTPSHVWQSAIIGSATRPGRGLPEVPGNPEKLVLDFMPFVQRTIQPYGVVIDEVHYYDEVLNPWINAASIDSAKLKRSFLFRRDPRDISRIWFWDPDAKQYFEIPYRDLSHPAVSLWEFRDAQQRLKKEGQSHVDERAIFAAIERQRQRVEEAVTKTKAVRRQAQRAAAVKTARPEKPAAEQISPAPPSDEPDIFAVPPPIIDDSGVL